MKLAFVAGVVSLDLDETSGNGWDDGFVGLVCHGILLREKTSVVPFDSAGPALRVSAAELLRIRTSLELLSRFCGTNRVCNLLTLDAVALTSQQCLAPLIDLGQVIGHDDRYFSAPDFDQFVQH